MNSYQESIPIDILPLENIFLLSIDGFESLMRVISKYGSILSKILSDAVLNNSNPQSKKFVFEMHLDKYDIGDISLPYIQQPFDSMVNDLIDYLK